MTKTQNAETIVNSLNNATDALDDAIINIRIAHAAVKSDNEANLPRVSDLLGTAHLLRSATIQEFYVWQTYLANRRA